MEPLRMFLENASNAITVVTAFLAPTAAASSLGVLPRAGPGRALVLGLSTRLWPFRPQIVVSQRTSDVVNVRKSMDLLEEDQYVVVYGQKGVGKSTIVNNALHGAAGVLVVDVAPAATHKEIVLDVMRAVTRYNVNFLDVYSGASRVIRWHTRFFRVKPTVVLRVRERAVDDKHASVGSAARVLVEHGLLVLIDSSDNSLQALATSSRRQCLVHVEAMDLEVLQRVPELADLLAVVEKAGDAAVVWAVLGGVPALYQLLALEWRRADSPLDVKDVREVVDLYLGSLINEAHDNVLDATTGNKALKELYARFKTVNELPVSELEAMGVSQPSPDKVLRRVKKSGAGGTVLVPATSAMALVLRYAADARPPTVAQLRHMLAVQQPSSRQMST